MIHGRTIRHFGGVFLLGSTLVVSSLATISAQESRAQNDQGVERSERPRNGASSGEKKSGVFGQIGDWFDRQFSNMKADMKSAKDNFDRDADRATKSAKDAADAVVRLPDQRTVRGREICLVAPNGAPDCESAASKLCKAQGYGSGKSLDATTAETCPPQVLLSGRTPAPGECKTETFINRALCSP